MNVVVLDLETRSATELHRPRPDEPFVRLAGLATSRGYLYFTDPAALLAELAHADVIVGHNLLRFDLPALARHAGADYAELAAKAVDTIILARLADPPGAKGQKPWGQAGYYGLDATAKRLGGPGKTAELGQLGKAHGGIEKIPVDDPEFRRYLRGDLRSTLFVYGALGAVQADEYARREHRVSAIQNQMTISGWRIDEDLLAKRVDEEEHRRLDALEILARDYGVPTKGKAPLSSTAGREALAQAFLAAGATEVPLTATGKLNLSSAAMGAGTWTLARQLYPGMLRRFGHLDGVRRLVELVALVVGASAKYAEIAKYLVGGRVHAGIGEDQASGRWAMTKPSLTNLGKRGAKVVQRQVFLPEPGHVMLSADLDQVDMRALAALSQDPAYMALFAPGMDAHAEIAELVLGDRSRREEAKPIGHGWNYGRSVQAIADATGIPLATVQHFDAEMRRRFPRLCQWREDVRVAAENGRLLDNGFGRRMRCDPRRAYTQAPALMGQGAARDLMCTGLLRIAPQLRPHLRAVVHDEIVLSVPAEWVEAVTVHLRECLTFDWRGVPITAGVSQPGENWAACYRKD